MSPTNSLTIRFHDGTDATFGDGTRYALHRDSVDILTPDGDQVAYPAWDVLDTVADVAPDPTTTTAA